MELTGEQVSCSGSTIPSIWKARDAAERQTFRQLRVNYLNTKIAIVARASYDMPSKYSNLMS